MRLTLALTLCTTTALAQTPAAVQQAALCAGTLAYPQMPAPPASLMPVTKGKQQIDQMRGGKVIATYPAFADGPGCTEKGDGTDWQNPAPAAASGCGPFTREHHYSLYAAGDLFLVHPGIYSGDLNQPYIGPQFNSGADYPQNPSIPTNITIRGIPDAQGNLPEILLNGDVSNNTFGQAMVYIDRSSGVTFERLVIAGTMPSPVSHAGLYEVGGSNFTLRNVRITGFLPANCMQGGGQMEGDVTLDHVEIDHCGGTASSYNHGFYMSDSATDTTLRLNVQHSYFHDVAQGHLLKTRAFRGDIGFNVFRGGLPLQGQTQAEAYLLDMPNGGKYFVHDNQFLKTASGVGSNGVFLAFNEEGLGCQQWASGCLAPRPQELTVRNNTFSAYARTYDGSHPLFPFLLNYPAQIPPIKGLPVAVSGGVFAGFCPAGVPALDWRGVGVSVGVLP